MNKLLVLTHRADFDGVCSMEIAKRFLGRTADYLGWDYGDELPDLEERQIVYMIDISLPPAIMEKYKNKIIWIDHHKSAIDAINPGITGIRIDGVAACRLAWQFFYGKMETFPSKENFMEPLEGEMNYKFQEPYAVRLLGQFDIWDKRDPNTDIFQVGLASVKNIDWNELFSEERYGGKYSRSIIERGRAVWGYMEIVNKQISVERGFDVHFEGFNFRALNIARCNSLTFKDSIKEYHDGCLGYFWNGSKWKFSLYGAEHKKDLDLSVIAKKYGGGGHRQACGFELSEIPAEFGGIIPMGLGGTK